MRNPSAARCPRTISITRRKRDGARRGKEQIKQGEYRASGNWGARGTRGIWPRAVGGHRMALDMADRIDSMGKPPPAPRPHRCGRAPHRPCARSGVLAARPFHAQPHRRGLSSGCCDRHYRCTWSSALAYGRGAVRPAHGAREKRARRFDHGARSRVAARRELSRVRRLPCRIALGVREHARRIASSRPRAR